MRLDSPSSNLASAAVFLSASIWGLYWIPLRFLEARGLEGAWSVAFLNMPAALFLALFVGLRWRSNRVHFYYAMLIGLFTGIGLALYACGLVYSSVVRATLLFYLTPVWATLIGIFWLDERAGWQRWAAMGIGMCGLLLLVSGGGSVPLNIGDLYALLSGLFWASGAAMIKRYGSVPLAPMTMFQFAVTALTACLLGFISGVMEWPDKQLVTQIMPFASGVSIMVILPSVLILFWAQKFLFPGRVGLLMMSEVLAAVITASLLLPEERMSAIEWTGATLIVGACLIEVLLTPQPTRRSA